MDKTKLKHYRLCKKIVEWNIKKRFWDSLSQDPPNSVKNPDFIKDALDYLCVGDE